MDLIQIFGLLILGVILFLPLIIFHPKIKDKLKDKNK